MKYWDIIRATYSIILPMILVWVGNQAKKSKEEKEQVTKAIENLDRKMDAQQHDILQIKRQIDDNKAEATRYRIIRIDDDIQHGGRISSDHAIQILDDIDCYKKYCNEHPDFQNHRGKTAMERVAAAYMRGELTHE